MKTQELKTVVAIHTTATSVHFLDENGQPVIKLRVGDAYYVDEEGKMYICKKKFAKQCGYERHFLLDDEPVAINKVDFDEHRKIDAHKHLSFVTIGCICFKSAFDWYSDTCTKLCFD